MPHHYVKGISALSYCKLRLLSGKYMYSFVFAINIALGIVLFMAASNNGSWDFLWMMFLKENLITAA